MAPSDERRPTLAERLRRRREELTAQGHRGSSLDDSRRSPSGDDGVPISLERYRFGGPVPPPE